MNKIETVRAEAIDACLKKTATGKILWTYSAADRSAQASFSGFSMHIDLKKDGNRETVKIWIFNESGTNIDYFSISDNPVARSEDPLHIYYNDLLKLVRDVATEEKVKTMDSFLSSLKNL